MVRRLLPLFLLVLCPLSLFAADDFRPATAEETAMTDVPWSPGASAVVLDWDVRHDDRDSRATEYVRIKILTDEGKKYGDIELVSIPGYHQVRDIRARTIAPDGAVSVFNGKIYDKVVVKTGGFRMLQKTFTLPNVKAGTILEYRFTVTWPASRLRTNRWPVQREIPIRQASFWIRPYPGFHSVCTTKGLPAEVKPASVKDHFEMNVSKTAAFRSEPYTLPEEELKPRLEFFYTYSGNTQSYWSDVAEYLSAAVEKFIGDRKGIKAAAAEITSGATTSEEKLQKIYARVQQIRNLSFERDKTEQEEKREKLRDNNHIEDVLERGYGNGSEINRLFAGLARAAGFDAKIVFTSSRDAILFSREIPDVEQLRGDIVSVVVDGKERYFDPATVHARFGILPWQQTAVPGLKILGRSKWEWVTTPELPYATAVTARTADLQIVDGVVKGTATVTYRGQDALIHRLESRNEDEAANRKRFEDEIKELFSEGSTVKLTNLMHVGGTDEPLVVSFDVELPNLGTIAGSRALIPMSAFAAASKNPFAAAERQFAIYFHYQHQIEDRVTLRLPEGYGVESLPKPVVIDVGALAFSTSHKRDAETITFERKMTVKTMAVPAASYQPLRKFYGQVVTADHDEVVLKKGV